MTGCIAVTEEDMGNTRVAKQNISKLEGWRLIELRHPIETEQGLISRDNDDSHCFMENSLLLKSGFCHLFTKLQMAPSSAGISKQADPSDLQPDGGFHKFIQCSSIGTSSGICSQSSTILPNIDDLYNFSQDEDAIIIANEVTKQTIGFYKNHNEKLKCNDKAWERLHELLNYQGNQLNDCIPEGAENSQIKQRLSEYFNVLEQIVNKNDDSCVHMIVQLNMKRNLQLVAQLSSRMRSRLLQKSSQSDNVI
ncbi:uncharacterized protein LOC134566202 [Pelobates fuscus]|uniref:uncharacterized protein LOC134566202 n=1 Tax=Pelobates fuscus TaxID=191477 RepID=UPI002FE494D8